MSSVANAESFLCTGQGKYAAIGELVPVTVEWKNPNVSFSKVLMNQQGITVTFSIDKSNSGRSHYAEIYVSNTTTKPFTGTTAKGSIYDMVFLVESSGSQISQIACAPNPIIVQ